jgi:hypothetical protein
VLELSGVWGPHANIEKHVMGLREDFSEQV